MGNENGQPHDVRDRIASFIRAEVQAEPKPASPEDVRNLQSAASRLDQLLTGIKERDRRLTEDDQKAFQRAAGKLDQLLKASALPAGDLKPPRRQREETDPCRNSE